MSKKLKTNSYSYSLTPTQKKELELAIDEHTALHYLRISMIKADHKLNPYYCSNCFRSSIPAEGKGKDFLLTQDVKSICCDEQLLYPEEALTKIDHLILIKSNLIKAFKTGKIKPASNGTKHEKPSYNEEDDITLAFPNENVIIAGGAKRARKWLRKHGLTVNDATKEANTWTFTTPLEK